MRKVRFSVAVSLDGFIAGPDGGLDWLIWSDDAARLAGEHWRDFDTVLLGRRTYDFAAASGQTEGDPGGVRSFIFSRRLAISPSPHADLVRDDAVGAVRAAKAGPGKDIILMGGGELASTLIGAGLVDEIGLNLHPVVLGGGTPLFTPEAAGAKLGLVEARPLDRGCVWLVYRPTD